MKIMIDHMSSLNDEGGGVYRKTQKKEDLNNKIKLKRISEKICETKKLKKKDLCTLCTIWDLF